jgi:anti-anti-sigma regulatory factor
MSQVLEPEEFRHDIRTSPGRDAATVTVRPGRSLDTRRDVEGLRRAVTGALHDGVREVVVDLSGARTVSVDAIAVLLVLKADAQRYGVRVRATGASRSVERKLRTTGALPHLT